jgi:hypothetical protein
VPELTTGKYPPTNTVPDPVISPEPVALPHPTITFEVRVDGLGGGVIDDRIEERDVLENRSVATEDSVVTLDGELRVLALEDAVD